MAEPDDAGDENQVVQRVNGFHLKRYFPSPPAADVS